jgi:hypothetical protein
MATPPPLDHRQNARRRGALATATRQQREPAGDMRLGAHLGMQSGDEPSRNVRTLAKMYV